MDNSWKVFWWEEGRKKFRRFNQHKPTEAVAFAKDLKKKGIEVAVVSGRKAYRIPESKKFNREPGMLWCPYCVEWRRFKEFALKKENYVTGADFRCPVCTISTADYFVRKYNEEIREAASLLYQEAKPRRKRDG
jgi:hypothetical protein